MTEVQVGGESTANFHDQAEMIISAYQEIGLTSERAHDVLVEKATLELGNLAIAANGLDYESYVLPSAVQSKGLWDIVKGYDPSLNTETLRADPDASFVFKSLWGQYEPEQLLFPPTARTFVAGMVLGGYNEKDPGLHALALQGSARKSVLREKIMQLSPEQKQAVTVEVLDPAAWVALHAIRRIQGAPHLHGFTSFDLPAKYVDGVLREPYATASNSKGLLFGSTGLEFITPKALFNLHLGEITPYTPRRDSGTRLAVSQKPSSESMPARIIEPENELEAQTHADELIHQAA